MRSETPPFISILMPVRNEAACISNTLHQLLGQQFHADRFEVLVADGRSTDATRAIVGAIAAAHANVHLLDNPRRWSSAGRNVAVRAAHGDILLVIDGHCDLRNPYYLRDLVDAFNRSDADCVGRPQPLDVERATPLQRAVAAARSSWLGHQPVSYVYSSVEGFVPPESVAIAYRRQVFDRVGLFDESFDACEDVEFNHRVRQAGFRCFFTPRLRVYYHPRKSLIGLFQQMLRYGRGRVRLARKHPGTASIASMLPGVFMLGVALGPLASLFSTWLAFVYLGALGLYALLVLAASASCAVAGRDARTLPWLPAVFAAIHAGAGAGILRELASLLSRHTRAHAEETSATETPPDERRAA